jgi:large subunit ribosomal protein L23
MLLDMHDILIEPVLSEKATALREENKYTFVVHPDASKIQIKEAVRRLFNVKVLDCTTINVQGKMKRLRGRPGRTASYKKAIVKLAPGESIKVFEGV